MDSGSNKGAGARAQLDILVVSWHNTGTTEAKLLLLCCTYESSEYLITAFFNKTGFDGARFGIDSCLW